MVIKFPVVPPAPADVLLRLGDSDTWHKGYLCRKEYALSAWVIRVNAPELRKALRAWEDSSVVRECFPYKHGEFKLIAFM